MENKIDIFEVLESQENNHNIIEFNYTPEKEEKYKTISFTYKIKKEIKAIAFLVGFIKYITTSATIFAILLLTANYSAYIDLAKAYISPETAKKESINIINSVEASKISETIKTKSIKEKNIEKLNSRKAQYSIKKIALNTNKKKINLDIEITPYENRLIIPKIGKNIPIVEVKAKEVKTANELENIFMKELEDGVIRYPGSSKPGRHGNTFIFGHSSNYPWIKGDYNEVFANLGKLSYGNEIIIYYGQKKYVYVVRQKTVITPGDTEILKRNKNKDELTLMTCWPVGTTLNRLIVIAELKK